MQPYRQKLSEKIITRTIQFTGYLSILYVALICLFLAKEGFPALSLASPDVLFNSRWYPIEGLFGILPLLFGSLLVTILAIVIALPLGIGTAVYISEVASPRIKNLLKPGIEILAGIPSVVLGFFGILVLAPFLRRLLDLPTGLNALTGAMLLAWASLPTIVSIAEDALNAVPQSYREASWAVGATQWQTIWGVTLPAAKSGVITAVMLGMGRVIGETMAVMMVTGNAPVMPESLEVIFSPIRTMTATIASEMGEVATGSAHYHVLFFIGMVLFIFALVINIITVTLTSRRLSRSERLLS